MSAWLDHATVPTLEYRAGQRVRIEWPNGSALEGIVARGHDGLVIPVPWERPNRPNSDGLYLNSLAAHRGAATVLPEPRPDEPTGLGAVVEAEEGAKRREWVRMPGAGAGRRRVWHDGSYLLGWDELTDPVVLSDGWVP